MPKQSEKRAMEFAQQLGVTVEETTGGRFVRLDRRDEQVGSLGPEDARDVAQELSDAATAAESLDRLDATGQRRRSPSPPF